MKLQLEASYELHGTTHTICAFIRLRWTPNENNDLVELKVGKGALILDDNVANIGIEEL